MPEPIIFPRAVVSLRSPAYELFIALVTVLALLNVLLWLLIPDPPLQSILLVMNAVLSIIFLIDFLYRARTAESFPTYFLHQFGWADLLSVVPFPLLKLLRLFRLVRSIRQFQAAGGRATWAKLKQERANSALMSLLMMGLLVLEFGSLLILRVEQDAKGALIVDASDALWYTIVTIATVGYGDEYPVTNEGRIAGAVIIVIGVGIFGTFTGYLANLFLAPRRRTLAARTGFPQASGAPTPSEQVKLESIESVEGDRMVQLEGLLAQSRALVAQLQELLDDNGGGSGETPPTE